MNQMKKRIFSFLLAAVMVLLLIPVIAVPVSATSTPISIVGGSFEGYKGWLTANDGQTRYKQRAYTYGLRDTNPITCAFDGDAGTWTSAYSVVSYYPEQYLNASGELVRDNTYDNVNVTVDFATYQASGLGKYYGVFKFSLEGLAELNTITIKAGPDGSKADSNKAFDILYSADGDHWAVAASYTDMTAPANWTSFADNVYTLNVPMGGVEARYVAYAVTTKSGQETGGLWLFEIAAEGTLLSESVSITAGSFEGYKTFLSSSNASRRKEKITLSSSHPIAHAYDGNQTGTYAGGTGGVGGYYPSLYINDSGELVRDDTYYNVSQTVNFSTYAESGLGKYYGAFKFTLAELTYLDTVTIWAGPDGSNVDNVKAFDVLYSADGIYWSVGASYTGMTAPANWTTAENDVFTLKVPMGGVVAKYIAFAPSIKDGQFNSSLWLFEIAAAGTEIDVSGSTVYEVGTAKELATAILLHNVSKSTADVIRLTADVALASTWDNLGDRYIYGTFDGQGHTIYNLQASFVWPYGNCLIKNFTVSNKTASDGEYFSISGVGNVFGGNAVASEIAAGKTAVIQNVTNDRDLLGSSNVNGGFFGSLTIAGTVRLENCVNNGDYLQNGGSGSANLNHKIGGFVGTMSGGTVVFVNCTNNGNVTASQAGGFIGIYDAGTTMTLTNCTNNGDITGLANGTAYGVAGGLIGGFNNSGTIGSDTTITITGCTNTGDVKVNYTADTNKDCAVGGFIGHAGGSAGETVYNITIDNCGVYNCTIDAVGDDATYGNTDSGKEYAASFIGKISPRGTEHNIAAKRSYVNGVNVRADHARRFIGVGSFNTDIPAKAINLVVVNLNQLNVETGEVEEWSGARNSGCSMKYSAESGDIFTQTDAGAITGGTAGFVQTADTNADEVTDKVRFASTLGSNLDDYAQVGYMIIATWGDSNIRGWTKSSKYVYTSLYAPDGSGTTKTANQIHSGDSVIFAMTIEEISPYIGDVNFKAIPFVVLNDGRILFGRNGSSEISFGSL